MKASFEHLIKENFKQNHQNHWYLAFLEELKKSSSKNDTQNPSLHLSYKKFEINDKNLHEFIKGQINQNGIFSSLTYLTEKEFFDVRNKAIKRVRSKTNNYLLSFDSINEKTSPLSILRQFKETVISKLNIEICSIVLNSFFLTNKISHVEKEELSTIDCLFLPDTDYKATQWFLKETTIPDICLTISVQNLRDSLFNFFRNIFEAAKKEKQPDNLLNRVSLRILAGNNILETISAVLSARIIRQALYDHFTVGVPQPFRIYLQCQPDHEAKDPNEQLIRYTTQSFAGFLSLADTLIYPALPEGNFNEKFIYPQNIFKILKEESFFGASDRKSAPPWSAEKAAANLAEEILKKLQQESGLSELPEFKEKDNDPVTGFPGMPPFIRGPYASMYVGRPWTIRQYAGFSTAEESNRFYKDNLAAGQKGLSVAFDLPTHRGYDSDNPRVRGDIGKAGVAVDSVEDMKILFDGIPLDKISVSMTMNGAVIPVMAFYLIAAKEQGIDTSNLRGTLQNDILKEFMVRNTYIYPPEPSIRIIKDIFSYTSKNMPLFNPISISGYHMHEAGATAEQELAFTLADGLEYVRAGIEAGLKVDDIAPRFSFFWGIGMNFYTEVAKMRAARGLWALLMKEFNPENPKSMMLRTHCQTSGWSLIGQDINNNVTRTTIEALAAVMGHTQSLHTNSMDEALALPSPYTAGIARETQLYLQKKTDITNTIDPLGGHGQTEALTLELGTKAYKLIKELEEEGGMAAAIQKGIPQKAIADAAAARQAKIDSGEEKVIGLNTNSLGDKQQADLLDIDLEKVMKVQTERLAKLRKERDEEKVQRYLNNILNIARSGKGNLLEAAIEAAEARATLGEISLAMENEFGRYKGKITVSSGIYAMQNKNKDDINEVQQIASVFQNRKGRRPRILVAKMGQDGHDRGAKIIASGFADLGFDVDLGPLFQTPEEVARHAGESDVHLVGISSLAGSHKKLVPELIDELKKIGFGHVKVITGGIIPEKDHQYLREKGVAGIYGPGTNLVQAGKELLEMLLQEG